MASSSEEYNHSSSNQTSCFVEGFAATFIMRPEHRDGYLFLKLTQLNVSEVESGIPGTQQTTISISMKSEDREG